MEHFFFTSIDVTFYVMFYVFMDYTVRFSHRKHNLIAVFGIDVFNVPIIVTVRAYPLRSEAINLRTNYYVLL